MSDAPAAFDAWHLPGASASGDHAMQAGTLTFQYPEPHADLLEASIRHLRAAGRRLAERDLGGIVTSIDAVARRFDDPADPLAQRAESLVRQGAGYSAAMARLVIRRMAADWRAGPLHGLIEAELGGAGPLDGFVPGRGGRTARAYGPRLAFHVFAGNVPGVAVTSLVRTLLVRAPSFGKLAAGEPVLPVLFARALAEQDADLGDAIALTYWPGGSEAPEGRLMEAADTLIVYGGEAAAASLQRRAGPDHRVLLHGPRFSVGLVGAPAAAAPEREGLAGEIAHAVATFDQQGCVSPHAVYVEDPEGTAGPALAEAVAAALRAAETELPRGRITAREAAAIQQERGAAELRGHAGEEVRVFAGEGTSWTVVYDPAPRFRPSCLNRFLHVHSVPRLEEAVEVLRPGGAQIQSVAVAGAGERLPELADRLARIGATRITTFRRLPWPPAHWHHDGRGPLQELVRWVDLES